MDKLLLDSDNYTAKCKHITRRMDSLPLSEADFHPRALSSVPVRDPVTKSIGHPHRAAFDFGYNPFMYEIRYTSEAMADLAVLRKFDCRLGAATWKISRSVRHRRRSEDRGYSSRWRKDWQPVVYQK
jgi:hypothetical protein